MGACGSTSSMSADQKAAKKRNDQIEKELYHQRKRLAEEVKLLLLGTVALDGT